MKIKKPTKIELIIFDLDGTLIDLNVNWRDLKTILQNKFNSFELPLVKGISKLTLNEKYLALKIISKFELENKHHVYTNRIQYIKKLNNVKLGLVTNNTKNTTKSVLSLLNIYEKFSGIVTLDDVQTGKPEPEGLNYILKKLNVSKTNTIFLGDKDTDMTAGTLAGIYTITQKKHLDNFFKSGNIS
ncbi:Pyrophosphatase PpaX protein [Marine Group I thaumarchaeote SCGC AAA799-B03]|uniref:Pyrophosphatase PpaX protein n=1 Tax=Marine Group I thaumarchaeote SCGC AAA799-B03 TaxID=1502289 RepID=A0A087S920_9ARCH|nr:Pyrophosphatase PpaX protein [Marine Group I thaumarchaeote SCGC AAA799-B03]